MRQPLPLNLRRGPLVGSVDMTLKRALAPILSEELPPRLCAVLDALRHKGSADDTGFHPDPDLPR